MDACWAGDEVDLLGLPAPCVKQACHYVRHLKVSSFKIRCRAVNLGPERHVARSKPGYPFTLFTIFEWFCRSRGAPWRIDTRPRRGTQWTRKLVWLNHRYVCCETLSKINLRINSACTTIFFFYYGCDWVSYTGLGGQVGLVFSFARQFVHWFISYRRSRPVAISRRCSCIWNRQEHRRVLVN